MFKCVEHVLIIIGCLITFNSYSQSFEYILKTAIDETPADVIQDALGNHYISCNHGYLITGSLGNYEGIVVKLNPFGDSIAQLTYRYNNQNTLFVSALINDSTQLIFIGITYDSIAADWQILFLKTDTLLTIINEKVIGQTDKDEIVINARYESNNTILISGYAGFLGSALMFYELSSEGDSIRAFILPAIIQQPMAYDLIRDRSSNRFIGLVFGYSVAQPIPIITAQMLLMDSAWNVDSVIFIYNSGYTLSAEWQNDSVFLLAASGYDPFTIPLDDDLKLMGFTNSFVPIIDTLFGTTDTADFESIHSISVLDNGCFYIGGTVSSQNTLWSTDPAYFNVFKFNQDFSMNWYRYINFNNECLRLYKVLATQDGGVLLAGTKYNAATANGLERDIYVIKLDSLGNFVTGLEEQGGLQISDFIVYPNPATHQLTVQYSPVNQPGKAILFNSLGEAVTEITLPPNSASQKINISHLPSGIYLLRMETEKYSGAKKFVKF